MRLTTSLANMYGMTFFQMLPNIRGTDPKFESLDGKIKITPNFEGVNSNLVKG
jgi:hypothetical protein